MHIELIEKGICPISGKKADKIITIYKWKIYIITYEVKKINIPVSKEGYKFHHKNTGTWWEVFNVFAGDLLINIPLLGGIFILMFIIYGGILAIPLWITLDLIMKKRIYGKGVIRFNGEGDIYIDIEKVKNIKNRLLYKYSYTYI